MDKQVRVLTNNHLVEQSLDVRKACAVDYCAGTLNELMMKVRDLVHLGYRLCTHPLSGSIKPNQTPYKSIGLSDLAQKPLCTDSLMMIEHSIALCRCSALITHQATPNILKDFQLIDLTLILSAIEGMNLERSHTAAPNTPN
ncbi:MAG: GrdX protein [Clostridiales bacterium]|nr:GrdX protein [Clostridiales bacterium]